ncbi:hypothetical protein AGMMS49957_08660 [Synergistales bacterium]|nr:hypothetical protein AGMMS49957_08660 [Synergistales bacterium]
MADDKNAKNAKTPFYNKIELAIIVVLFTAMVAITFMSVILRYFFSFTFSWAEQLTRVMYVWITYAGVSWAGGLNVHLRVYALCELLGKRIGYWIFLFGDIVTIIFGFFMSYKVSYIMMNALKRGQTFPSMSWCPVWVMYLAGVLGLAGLSLRIIQSRVVMSRGGKNAQVVMEE